MGYVSVVLEYGKGTDLFFAARVGSMGYVSVVLEYGKGTQYLMTVACELWCA
jgi:hypothetical protein